MNTKGIPFLFSPLLILIGRVGVKNSLCDEQVTSCTGVLVQLARGRPPCGTRRMR
jgi:hypothetical protein